MFVPPCPVMSWWVPFSEKSSASGLRATHWQRIGKFERLCPKMSYGAMPSLNFVGHLGPHCHKQLDLLQVAVSHGLCHDSP